MQLGEIDTNRIEGRLLMAAIRCFSAGEGDEEARGKLQKNYLDTLLAVQADMYEKAGPCLDIPSTGFLEGLRLAVNKNNMERGTPDFILAKYLETCYNAFMDANQERGDWYGKKYGEVF